MEPAPLQDYNLQQMQGQEGAWTPLILQQSRVSRTKTHRVSENHQSHFGTWGLIYNFKLIQTKAEWDKVLQRVTDHSSTRNTSSVWAAGTQMWAQEAACALSSSLLPSWICPHRSECALPLLGVFPLWRHQLTRTLRRALCGFAA